ncbi:dipeptidyl peptidase IV N-terminal region-domain-containing protein [Coniella lustricola]|uniref:Probable dipeptidyl-aminopeptidase B n=1 Tax=Coniella lustricola TaxID=2025994 RepID=A0A2T3A901_9PEZI|nr:dipeptidyl peptidase IV N-terminal region-domain-containing protein [Coniella lustricola]
MSSETTSSVSTTSIVFDRISERLAGQARSSSKRRSSPSPRRMHARPYADDETLSDFNEDDPLKQETSNSDLETGPLIGDGAGTPKQPQRMDKTLRRMILCLAGAFLAVWVIALAIFVSSKSYQHPSNFEHDPQATVTRGSGKKLTLDTIMSGSWIANSHTLAWVAGPNGEDGLLLEQGGSSDGYLVAEDVRKRNPELQASVATMDTKVLMKNGWFSYHGSQHQATKATPNAEMSKVLISSDQTSVFRHSVTAKYWVFDVASQTAEPLVPGEPDAVIQLAKWSPASNAVAFVKENNLYVRFVGTQEVRQITDDGGANYFYGRPDWVYEEEVLGGDSATWWSQDGKFLAFFRTNDTAVPVYKVQYYISKPKGSQAEAIENYPQELEMKYPKAGAPNPVVDLLFYDLNQGDKFEVNIDGGFADDDRLITEVVWAGENVLIKETNRVSDVMRVVLVDVTSRTGKTVRTDDVGKLDGGWFEISQKTRFIPADPANQRPYDGYIDTVVYDNGDHLAYFTPLDNPEPIMLTKGQWEVENAPSAVDLNKNLVYFIATKQSSIERHAYSVKLDGSGIEPVTDTSSEGYYSLSFSTGAGFALVNYQGPNIPWQKVISTPSNSNKYEHVIEKNDELANRAKKYELPIKIYGTLKVDEGVELNYVERRPPHFDSKKKYPVLFFQYSGPNSQSVNKKFAVDFQSNIASLGYICVTVDGRGTGFIGRKNRVVVREHLGYWESHDQIEAAKHWASLSYVDPTRLAIWGWSYGGFNTLKTLEQDAGRTFSYGMAVAPVTDWRYYDSIYTERYMKTPQENEAGYDGTAISNATALGQNKRFLIMHGTGDDNVHVQNTLTLLDKLDLAAVENYDVHVFPDSDHSIYFHNANKIVYEKLQNWIINAFNGEWLKVDDPVPNGNKRSIDVEIDLPAA